jgi:heme/copper-type cytochrome/quinol oxidase subunit 3
MAPSAHFATVLITFLFVAAAITALYAIRQSEKLAPEHFIQWDVAAALMALSFLARFFEKRESEPK